VAHVRSSIVLDRLKESSKLRSRSCVANFAGEMAEIEGFFGIPRPAFDLR